MGGLIKRKKICYSTLWVMKLNEISSFKTRPKNNTFLPVLLLIRDYQPDKWSKLAWHRSTETWNLSRQARAGGLISCFWKLMYSLLIFFLFFFIFKRPLSIYLFTSFLLMEMEYQILAIEQTTRRRDQINWKAFRCWRLVISGSRVKT